MQLTYLFKGLALSPAVVERVVAAIPASAYDEKRDPDRFSFREAIAHLADWETINQERLNAGIANPGCTVQGLDEVQVALDRGYSTWDPNKQARTFAVRRKATVDLLHGLSEEDWAKTVIHSERGEMTILELAVSTLGHDVYHLDQFTQYLD